MGPGPGPGPGGASENWETRCQWARPGVLVSLSLRAGFKFKLLR